MTPTQRKNSRKNKQYYWKFPVASELSIDTALRRAFRPVVIRTYKLIKEYMKRYGVSVKFDSDITTLYNALESERAIAKEEDDDTLIILPMVTLNKESENIRKFTLGEFEKWLLLYGVTNLPTEVGAWEQFRLNFLQSIKGKMKGNIDDFFNKVEELLTQLQTNKISPVSFANKINKVFNYYATARVSNSVRDAVGTLNASIQKSIALNHGLHVFVWQTMRDERVRGNPAGLYPKSIPSHYIMQGTYGDWTRPDLYSTDGNVWSMKYGDMEFLLPGEAWGCRCTGQPVMVDMLREVDRSLL